MYEFLSQDKVAELAAHDDPDVRHLAEDARQLAAELLLARFRALGERFFKEADPPELPRLLWQAVQEGPKELSEEEVEELERLSALAAGWWRPGDRGAMELVDLDEWRETYREG